MIDPKIAPEDFGEAWTALMESISSDGVELPEDLIARVPGKRRAKARRDGPQARRGRGRERPGDAGVRADRFSASCRGSRARFGAAGVQTVKPRRLPYIISGVKGHNGYYVHHLEQPGFPVKAAD